MQQIETIFNNNSHIKKLPVNFLYVFSLFDKRYVKLNIEHNFEYFYFYKFKKLLKSHYFYSF